MNPSMLPVSPVNDANATGLDASIESLYRHRFPREMLDRRAAVWRILCRSWFARYIPPNARVLEVAAGYCEFINNISAAEKVAIDLNPETRYFAAPEVTVHHVAAEHLTSVITPGTFDTVFMSNFLEHCRTRDQVLDVLRACFAALRPGGRLLILGPNFQFCYKQYFDFFDHHLALTHNAVAEALQVAGFEIELLKARSLPLTFKGRLPPYPALVKLYLRLPMFWPLFGKQFFVVGRKAS
jgi:SAM-dependent methyltransferase